MTSISKIRSFAIGSTALMALALGACEETESTAEGVDASGSASTVDPSANKDASVSSDAAAAPAGPTPTWHQDIAPILSHKCSSCHTAGGIAPFSVKEYSIAKKFADQMVAAVEDGRMPPFLAKETPECTPKNKFAKDVRLDATEKAKLRAWAKGGAPAGDSPKAAALVPPLPVDIEREDYSLPLPTSIVVPKDSTSDLHTCVVIDPKLKQDEWVVSRQITAGNSKVLHHVVSYVLKPSKADGTVLTKEQMNQLLIEKKGKGIGDRYDCFGGPAIEDTGITSEMLGAWAPGAQPDAAPPNSGQLLAKDSLVLLDVHYHPNSAADETDSTTKLSLMVAATRPGFTAKPILLGNFEKEQMYGAHVGKLLMQSGESQPAFLIPADTKDHVEEMTFKWALPMGPVRIYYTGTHMHYVGRDMMVKLENTVPVQGEEAKECLVHTPSWDFNWQGGYGYDAPYEKLPQVNDGDVIYMKCIYDNTKDNHFVASALEEQKKSATIDVKLGEDTLDEMCLAAIGIVYPNPPAP